MADNNGRVVYSVPHRSWGRSYGVRVFRTDVPAGGGATTTKARTAQCSTVQHSAAQQCLHWVSNCSARSEGPAQLCCLALSWMMHRLHGNGGFKLWWCLTYIKQQLLLRWGMPDAYAAAGFLLCCCCARCLTKLTLTTTMHCGRQTNWTTALLGWMQGEQ